MRIRDLFVSDVTRDIPPVVYLHDQSPEKLAAEVSEYIITGGWPEGHPNHTRVPKGIHEEYVGLLTHIAADLAKPGGPELPNVWISGFYGSGKSSFAKLLGLSLDDALLPDGTPLAEAWLRRDTSPTAAALRDAWEKLRRLIEPIGVVFDVGAVARDQEHVHAAAVRQVQRKLGYCSTEPLVADFELRMERDGEWAHFETTAAQVLGQPWVLVKDRALAEEDFSHVLSVMAPDRYPDPMAWITARAGTTTHGRSPEEAAGDIRDMLKFRKPEATLFLVIDEVSQYVLTSKDRVDRLRAFATALGATLRGRVWLLALGQQKLDQEADDSFLVWAKDRFPHRLRVHLAPTNIRDVVHRRLLQKRPEVESALRALFETNRADIKLFAYGGDKATPEEFVDVYPLLPGHIDLILQITSALRARSARAQGDDQAIRGLLQLLGELFRDRGLADADVGQLVTLDQMYDIQHTALDSDTQASMARLQGQCTDPADTLLVRVAKAVALLELIQDTTPTTPALVAQCLYDRVDRGNHVPDVTAALETLRSRNLLGYTEKLGYKIQSSTAEEWERERRDIGAPYETRVEIVVEALKHLMGTPERPRMQGRPFPWAAVFSDGRRASDLPLLDPRDEASVRVDFRYLTQDERLESAWVKRSDEGDLRERLLWIAGDTDQVHHLAGELARSKGMVRRYQPRRESLTPARKLQLQYEENNVEDRERQVRDAVAAAWMGGRMYFRARSLPPQDAGPSFAVSMHAAAERVLPDLYPHFVSTQVQPSELKQLLETDLSGPSPKFLSNDLGLLDVDDGRYVVSCAGVVPQRVLEAVVSQGGISGGALLQHFGGPPYGYTVNVVKACVAALVRAGRVRVQPEGGAEITAVRDAGVRELFESDRAFRRATIFPAAEPEVGVQDRARMANLLEQLTHARVERDDHVIADTVAREFPRLADRVRDVLRRLDQLPGERPIPAILPRLEDALAECLRAVRQTRPTVRLVKKHLDTLSDGLSRLRLYEGDLTDQAIQAMRRAHDVVSYQAAQLEAAGLGIETNVADAVRRVRERLTADRPWVDVASLDRDLEQIRLAYVTERRRRLAWQETEAEQARHRVTERRGFESLSADQAHGVLGPISRAITETTDDAVAPSIADLQDPFVARLARAEEEANRELDRLLSQGSQPLIATVDLGLRNREVATTAELDALLAELRARMEEILRTGRRIRLQ